MSNISTVMFISMYLPLLLFLIVQGFDLNEQMGNILSMACQEANKELQENGLIWQPQITYPHIQSSTPLHRIVYTLLPYMLFDPINQFPLVCKSGGADVLCPLCIRDGVSQCVTNMSVWENGISGRRLQLRLIHDVSNPVLLARKLYQCAKGHREIASCDPDIVKQLPHTFVDFITSHRSGLTKNLLHLCKQLLDKGLSLKSIEDLNQMRYETFYNEQRKRIMTELHINNKFIDNTKFEFQLLAFSEHGWSFALAKLISSAIFANFLKEEQIYRQLFSSLSAEWISCDRTYKSVANIGYHCSSDGKWINQYKAIFIILNEKGQPIQWKFTKTKNFDEASDSFTHLSERFKQQKKELKRLSP